MDDYQSILCFATHLLTKFTIYLPQTFNVPILLQKSGYDKGAFTESFIEHLKNKNKNFQGIKIQFVYLTGHSHLLQTPDNHRV